MSNYIWVLNPKGRMVEVDETLLPELLKKGFTKADGTENTISSSTFIPSDPNNADINFISTFWANNGMGRVGEEILLALDRLGLKINVKSLYTLEEGLQTRTLELLKKNYSPAKKTLMFSIPQPLEQFHDSETYLHVPWDTSKAPDEWVTLINKYCKKVYPTSHFTRETFLNSGIKVPMETIKHGVNTKRFPLLQRNWDGTFTFLTFGDISVRKGTDVLIEAFEKAFPPKIRNVKLIIKSNKTMDWGRIRIPNDDRIQVIEESYTHQQLLQLMKESHCLVFPSRAEGFGLPALEAMSTGMATILHNYGGLSMMCNDKYNFPCKSDGTMTPPEWHYPESYSLGGGIGTWTNPDMKHLSQLMKFVYEQRDKAKKKGELASVWVKKNWDWDSQIKRLWEDMNPELKQKTWGEFYNGDIITKGNCQSAINSHKEFFWTILGFKPKKIIETGCGTGEMAAWLTWKNKAIEGKTAGKETIEEVIAVDVDPKVIKIAKANMESLEGTAKIVKADAWHYQEKADLIFSQGLLEHFNDDELRDLISHQLEQAPVLVHSVPNSFYSKRDFGNERLLNNEQWYKIFEGFNLTIYNYWEENEHKIQSILIFQRDFAKKVSIIMPIWNQKEITIKAIEALRQNTPQDYELICIDNNSNDGIEKWLDQQKDLRVVHCSQNLGVPKAKNLGMAISRGEYFCFLDNDTEAGKDWLKTMLSVFDDPTVGFTGHEGYMIDYENNSFLGTKYKTEVNPEWISGSIFMFPKKLIKEVGMLFDADLWCVEDVDFCCKIRNVGYVGKLPMEPVKMKHLVSATASKLDFSVDRFNKWAGKVWTEWREFLIANKDGGVRIDIGVGDAPAPGYLHVDIQKKYHVEVIADCRKLPFESNTLAEVRNAHVIEHFTRVEMETIIEEWIRVLKVNGILRIICPDFRMICKKFISGEIDVERALSWTYGGQIDKYDFHFWMYTPETLTQLFMAHGLTNVGHKYTNEGWLEVTGIKLENSEKKTASEVSQEIPESLEEHIIKETFPIEKGELINEPKNKVKIGVYITHVHTFGGGENVTFQILSILGKLYPGQVEVISSEPWRINPEDFGIDLGGIKQVKEKGQNYDLFLNISHFKLHDPIGKINLVWIFYPQFNWQPQLNCYDGLITQSNFIQDEIQKKWGMKSLLAYPPTNISNFKIGKKEKIILTVGRFFKVEGGNNKNHDVMIEAFKKLPKDWKMIMVGTVQDENYFKEIKKLAEGLNIEFKHDISFDELVELYAKAKVYWHAAGFGTEEASSQEHFGMVAVEALASGCQTLVYNGGGICQIDGVKPWTSVNDLALKTINANEDCEYLRNQSRKYSVEAVTDLWKKIIDGQLKQIK